MLSLVQLCIGATAGLSIVGKRSHVLIPDDDEWEADGLRWYPGGRSAPLVSLVAQRFADFPG